MFSIQIMIHFFIEVYPNKIYIFVSTGRKNSVPPLVK